MDSESLKNAMPNDEYEVQDAPTILNKKGDFVAFKLDLDKPGRIFFDLSKAFNAMQGENGNVLPIEFFQNGQPKNLNGYTISIIGTYPDGKNTPFKVVANNATSGNYMCNFTFPFGFFKIQGQYAFYFELDNGSSSLKSAVCLIDVQTNITTMTVDFKEDVTTYDNEFDQWRNQMKQNMTDLQTQADTNKTLQTLISQTTKALDDNATGVITQALKDVPKLDQNNTFSGINSFNNNNVQSLTAQTATVNGNLSADSFSANTVTLKKLLLNGQDITEGLIKSTESIHGTPTNGITWFFADVFKLTFSSGVLAILDLEFNVPNNSTFQNASESSPVAAFQFPKGSLSGLGGTPFAVSGALLKLDTNNDTLDFCGTTNGWESWGKAVRGYAPTYAMFNS